MSRHKIVVLGGSVAVGTSAKLDVLQDCFQYGTRTVNTVRETQTWWSILQRILSDWVEGGVEVISAGVEGDTVNKGLARLDRDVLSRSPHCVLAMFGPEDVFAGTDPEAFRSSLDRMTEATRGPDTNLVLMTPPPFSERMTVQGLSLDEVRQRQDRLSHLVEMTRSLSRTKSVCLIDVHRCFLENWLAYDHLFEGWLPDGVAQSGMAPFVAGELEGVLGATELPRVTLCDFRKIYSNPDEDDRKHHAWTDATYFQGAFYVAFREGFGHCVPRPAYPFWSIIVLKSADGVTWEKEATLQVPNVQSSADPKLLTVDGRLFLYTPACHGGHQEFVNKEGPPPYFSTFGFERLGPGQWGEPFECAPGVFWRPRAWRDQYVVACYNPYPEVAPAGTDNGPNSWVLRLLASSDGRHWRAVSDISRDQSFNETDLWVHGDQLLAFSRHDARGDRFMRISTYLEQENRWETVSSGRIIEAPCVLENRGRLFVIGRTCAYPHEEFETLCAQFQKVSRGERDADLALAEKYHHGLHTGIFAIDGHRARLVMELLSAGDSSYPGAVRYGNEYLISDYSMHEYYRPIRRLAGKNTPDWNTPADIYVSRVRFGDP